LIFPLHLASTNPDQGESNADDPSSYACRFPAMISDWRKKMDLSLPFYFVQLAAYSQDFAEMREAQMAALDLRDVGYAVAIDLGDPQSPTGSVHSRRKQEVGRRLSLSALGNRYGKDVVTTGPVIRSASSISNTIILVEYVHGTAEGLHASGTAACEDCCRISPFEVLDANNGKWSRADFTIRGTRVELELKDIKAVAVRYNWEGYPQCAVYNGEGGPDDHLGIAATPFRVDIA
jgi:sialate O-acetylesterase